MDRLSVSDSLARRKPTTKQALPLSSTWTGRLVPSAFVAIVSLVVAALVLVLILRSSERCMPLARQLALGFLLGGAVGNGIDRVAYGWVVDFVFFHVSGADWRFNWYVFNLADVAIVAGVIGLLYESFVGDRAAKAP